MKGKIPTKRSLLHTLQGTIQSTAFLTTNAFPYSIFLCLIRKHLGHFNFWTVSYLPSFLASLCAIFVERKSRRTLLTLYVSNVATETLWRMAEWRGYVRSVKHGNVMVFGISVAVLSYYYRTHLHLINKDSLFNVFKFLIGPEEKYCPDDSEDGETSAPIASTSAQNEPKLLSKATIEKRNNHIIKFIQKLNLIKRHKSCPHDHDCLSYTLSGGGKMFMVGIGLQILLKLVLNVGRIIKNPFSLKRILFNKDTFKLGLFLGEFASLFRVCYCFYHLNCFIIFSSNKFFFFSLYLA